MKDRAKLNNSHWLYRPFLHAVVFVGVLLIVTSIVAMLQFEFMLNFALLVGLTIVSGMLITVRPAYGALGFAYDVGSGLSIAALPFFGLPGAILLNAVTALSSQYLWANGDSQQKGSLLQVFFNMGMLTIISVPTFWTFTWLRRTFGSDTITLVIGWLAAAIVYELANRAMLIIVIYLRNNAEVAFTDLAVDSRSEIALTITINFVGAALVGYAIREHDWQGIVIFFVPVLLSTLAYLIHVRNISGHMDQLEDKVLERTCLLEEANRKLEEANHQLEEANRKKDAFLRVVAHDMKSPLSVIRTYTSMLRENPEYALHRPKWLDSIASAESDLSRFVSDISDLEMWSRGPEIVLQASEFDVRQCAAEAMNLFRPNAHNKQITIQNCDTAPPILICADLYYIKRVFTNLVSNAVKYTPKGGTITAIVQSNGNEVAFAIQDMGYGIPAEALPHIFKEFYRVQEHQELSEGTGIGLAIVKTLVEAHGGTISVVSEVGTGSTFTVTLPLKQA